MKKGVSYSDAPALGAQFKPRMSRAYAEGRRVFPSAINPHPAGTDDQRAWNHGYVNRLNTDYKRDT